MCEGVGAGLSCGSGSDIQDNAFFIDFVYEGSKSCISSLLEAVSQCNWNCVVVVKSIFTTN